MKRLPIVPILGLLLAVGAAIWWWMNFERVPENSYVGLSGEARKDPYLAFKRLLARRGIRFDPPGTGVTPNQAFATLPPGGTLILLARRETLMAPPRIEALLGWVATGGHLIVAAESMARPDPLLASLGVRREMMRAPDTPKSGPPAASAPSRVALGLPGGGRPLQIEMATPTILASDARNMEWQAGDARGTRMLSLRRGAGRVTIASDLGWITFRGTGGNADPLRQPVHIGKSDHAEAIVALIGMDRRAPTAGVRLLGGGSDLSLWRWLLDNAWAALASLALLAVLWLWRVVPRFGPLAAPEPEAELRLTSHLAASGRFYRRHMSVAEIHQGLRRAFLQRLAERRPGIAARAVRERNAELARIAGVSAAAVARALDAPAQSIGDFVRGAILIKRLEQAL